MKRILLIAGHGNGDSGAVGNGYKEAELTRDMVEHVKAQFDGYANVTIADTSKNWYQYIVKQGNIFNFKNYDYVLEIHFNAIKEDKGDGKTKGTEIYVTKAEKGTAVETNIVNNISALGFANRGVKKNNYDLIKHIKNQGVSSALLEVCFIDDKDDMDIFVAKKKDIAKAIADGIVKGFGLTKSVKVEKDVPSTWAAEAFNKATKKTILDGTNPQGNVTREMLAVIFDRLGLLD